MVNLRTLMAASLIASAAMPVSATIFTITATGTLSNTLDEGGYFGGGDVDGGTFALTFLLDTLHSGASIDTTLASDGSTLYSFSGFGAANPLGTTLTINGISYDFGQNKGTLTASTLFATNGLPLTSYATFTADNAVDESGDAGALSWSNSDFSQLSLSFLMQQVALADMTTFTPGPFDMASGFFDIELLNSWYDSTTGDGGWSPVSAQGTMTVRSLTVTSDAVAPAVPEPATWLSMIAGFGAIGAGLRMRARKTRVAFA